MSPQINYSKIILILSTIIFFFTIPDGIAALMPQQDGIEDIDISDTVVDELFKDQVVAAHWIDVTTEDGIVTLSGRVGSILAKERSVLIAGTVKGVRGVINLLEVMPPLSVTDSGLKADVESALISDPATDLFQIDVGVSGGVIILTGHVDSWQEKRLCGIVAKNVMGVKEVQNDIVYETDPNRPASEIVNDIKQAIKWDALVDGSKVEVTVLEGKVILTGEVRSLAEKRRIINHAFLANATEVDPTGLEIAWWQHDDNIRNEGAIRFTDQEIRKAVRDVLFFDPRVSQFDIIVEVKNGTVIMRGTVDNLKAKQAASRSAENTVGVKKVKNRLKVRPVAVYLDAAIKEDIRKSMRRDPFIDLDQIRITVRAGVVNLSGSVETSFERLRAEELAMRVNGVVGVNNHLVVHGAPVPFPYDPYVDDWYAQDSPSAYDPGRIKTTKSDQEIAVDVKSELYWSPFVESDKIQVKVDDGVVTLTGTFDSRSEFVAATKNAYDGGAIAVNNKLFYKEQ